MLKNIILALFVCGSLGAQTDLSQLYAENLDVPESFIFVPPKDWLATDPARLPPSVKAMVIGKSEHGYPPSINIGLEPFEGSLKSYLKNVKLINESQNAIWKDLGQITTECGQASLSSVDMPTEWGDVRLLHAITIRYGTAYIMTCASLKEEFSKNYKDFLAAMRSMKINRDVYEMVGHPELRAKLLNQIQHLKKEHAQLPPEEFHKQWEAFLEKLDTDFSQMGSRWRSAMIAKAEKEIGF